MCNSTTRIKSFLKSIIDECDLLSVFVTMIPEDRNLGNSISDTMLFRSIAVSEQRIGEAATQIDKLSNGQVAQRYPSIPWREMRALRNHFVHEYLSIDESSIINTAIDDIPSIKPQIQQILDDFEKEITATE